MTRARPIGESLLLDLMNAPPIVRNTDPETSRASAEQTTRSVRGAQCWQLFGLVVAHPGQIAAVYVEQAGINGGWKRISDLVKMGYVHYRGKAYNEVTRRWCGCVWLGSGP